MINWLTFNMNSEDFEQKLQKLQLSNSFKVMKIVIYEILRRCGSSFRTVRLTTLE